MNHLQTHNQTLQSKSKQNEFKYNSISHIETNLKCYIYSIISCFISLLLGNILKIIYPMTRESFYISKLSNLILLPKGNHILISYSIFLLSIIIILIIFLYELSISNILSNENSNPSLNENNTNSNRSGSLYRILILNKQYIMRFLHRLRYLYFFRLTIIYIYFIFIYYFFIIPIYTTTKFKISGHFLSIIIANFIYSHIIILTNHLENSNFKSGVMKKLYIILNLIIYYNVYNLLFTSWIFHSLIESLIGFIIGCFSVALFSFVEFDHIVIGLFYNQQIFDSKDVIGNSE